VNRHTLGDGVRVPAAECPVCGATLDGAAQVDGAGTPEPGDVTVCAYCGAPLRFTDAGLELLTDAEAARITAENPAFAAARWAVAQLRRGQR
jgi:hypothetical protein